MLETANEQREVARVFISNAREDSPSVLQPSVLTLNLDCFVAVVGGQWSTKLAARIGARLHIQDKPATHATLIHRHHSTDGGRSL